MKFAQGRIQRAAQGEPGRQRLESWRRLVRQPPVLRRRSANLRVIPDDLQDDIFEIRIAVVAVRPPAAGAQINFHIAGKRRTGANLDHRAEKVRPAPGAGKAGMKYTNGFPVRCLEPVPAQALVQPDGLQQAFGGQVIFVTQGVHRAQPDAPQGIKIPGSWRHLEIAFAPTTGQSQVGV